MSAPALVVALAIVLVVWTVLARTRKPGKSAARNGWPVYAKQLLSPVEQKFYHRLTRSFPNHIVLSQVSMSQIVGVKKGQDFASVYNRFNRLVVDFVVCNRDFSVAAVLELDDRSHDRPKRQDADQRKEAVLNAAGIPLHRLNVNPLPDEAELRDLVTPEFPPIRAVRG
jgi:hypothetical protein